MTSFAPFSKKQMQALTWWCKGSRYYSCDAIICDGAVRSGKTMCLSLAFVAWATARFHGQSFALCGKTVQSLRRNLVEPLCSVLPGMGFLVEQKLSRNRLTLSRHGKTNTFYLFGGRDESSAALIQGMTLAGVLFDEVALMPRSFVEQALARCSVSGSRFWFNCNPQHPRHWFYEEWIQKAGVKKACYLHFTMEDNPSLAPEIRARYEGLYSGPFYERYVLGRWVAAEGLVYPMFRAEDVCKAPEQAEEYVISCDYGTVNPASFGLWGRVGNCWYRMREYYYSSREKGEQKTDEEYYEQLERLAGTLPVSLVVCDPSAASFLACIRKHGRFSVLPANNEVLDGIRRVADALAQGRIRICKGCADTIREFSLYRWEEGGRDQPRKENDHAMDDIRYFVSTVLDTPEEGPAALAVERAGNGQNNEEELWGY